MRLQAFRHFSSQAPLVFQQFEIHGTDAFVFLQGQSTQTLSTSWAIHSFLDRAGRVESYFIAWQAADRITLLVPQELSSAVAMRFERYVISEDVTLGDCGLKTWWLAMGGSEIGSIVGHLANQVAWLSSMPFSEITQQESTELLNYLYWQGVPSLAHPESIGELINQTRLFSSAVDLKKGCFPGQEVVAKIHHHRGAAWFPVLLKNTTHAAVPEQVFLEDKVVAKLHPQSDGEWLSADVLRDVRVEGLLLAGQFKVKLYPRWSIDKKDIAAELFHLGTDAFGQSLEKDARSYWELAIAADSTYADAYEAIGVLLGRQGSYVEAETWMRKLLVVDPTSVMAHTNLSLFLMRQDRIQEAEEHKAQATVAQFAVFGQKSRSEKAKQEALAREESARVQREAMFRQVLEIDPTDSLANFGLGGLCLERQQFLEATSYLTTVIQADPTYAVAYLALGKALKGLDRLSEAREIWQQGIKIAAKKGELMPANEMQSLLIDLG